MKKISIYNIKSTLAYSLVFAFSFMLFSKAFYTHNHIKNGVIYQHSHLFNKNKESKSPIKHNHSDTELTYINYLNIFNTENNPVVDLKITVTPVVGGFYFLSNDYNQNIKSIQSRAPPYFI